jgi:hypothetical protein
MAVIVVREASRLGPYHLLGTLVGESRKRYVYRHRSGGATAFVDSQYFWHGYVLIAVALMAAAFAITMAR